MDRPLRADVSFHPPERVAAGRGTRDTSSDGATFEYPWPKRPARRHVAWDRAGCAARPVACEPAGLQPSGHEVESWSNARRQARAGPLHGAGWGRRIGIGRLNLNDWSSASTGPDGAGERAQDGPLMRGRLRLNAVERRRVLRRGSTPRAQGAGPVGATRHAGAETGQHGLPHRGAHKGGLTQTRGRRRKRAVASGRDPRGLPELVGRSSDPGSPTQTRYARRSPA